jgi:hypothetical protein
MAIISREEIVRDLNEIARNHQLQGEAIDLQIDLLAYSLYHEQIEISNSMRELSLNTSQLLNSKISLSMDRMYSVYRGMNPVIVLNVFCNSFITVDKFGLLYTSNDFKIYAAEALNLAPTTVDNEGVRQAVQIKGIIVKTKDSFNGDKKVSTMVINKDTQHYLDVKLGNLLCSNLSEDLIVRIGTMTSRTEHRTTRIFTDHTRSAPPNDILFTQTIPDFGVRLYRRGYFAIDSVVEIEAMTYTTLGDISIAALDKVSIPGTTLVPTPEFPNGRKVIAEVPRETVRSILYNANLAGRVGVNIQSNSDVNYLFQEVFKSQILNSAFDFDDSSNTLRIYYIPRVPNEYLTINEINDFITNYSSYFITMNISVNPGREVRVPVYTEVVMSDSSSILAQVQEILDEFSYQLGISINRNLIASRIAKIPSVMYVRETTFPEVISEGLNIYYVFDVSVNHTKL